MTLTKSSIQKKDLTLLYNLKGYSYLSSHQKLLLQAIANLPAKERDEFLVKLDKAKGKFVPIFTKYLYSPKIYRLSPGTEIKQLKEALFPNVKNNSKPIFLEYDVVANFDGTWSYVNDGVEIEISSHVDQARFAGFLYGDVWYMTKMYQDVETKEYLANASISRKVTLALPSKIRFVSLKHKRNSK